MTQLQQSRTETSKIRALSENEIDDVSGGFFGLVLYGIACIGTGIGIGWCIATAGPKAEGSAPGDYPVAPKDTA